MSADRFVDALKTPMTGRPTAEIPTATLIAFAREQGLFVTADRLAELDADNGALEATVQGYINALHALDALRLPCPTCGGKKVIGECEMTCTADPCRHLAPCPENDGNCDGFMSHERAWKVVAAVFDEAREQRVDDLIANLRGIR